jgi:hypothetical protein
MDNSGGEGICENVIDVGNLEYPGGRNHIET